MAPPKPSARRCSRVRRTRASVASMTCVPAAMLVGSDWARRASPKLWSGGRRAEQALGGKRARRLQERPFTEQPRSPSGRASSVQCDEWLSLGRQVPFKGFSFVNGHPTSPE
jgi:hypothetical protein